MKVLLLALALLTGFAAYAQEGAAAYSLPRPEGWGSEEFGLPPPFAPAVRYQGQEVIRFAPGWADSTQAGYWSYVFVWLADGPVKTEPDTLRRQLISYYDGLYLANRKTPPVGYGPAFTQVRVTPNKPWPADAESWTGKAYTYNYLTGRQLDLLIRIHRRPTPDGKRTALLFEVSPKPFADSVWKSLADISGGFEFKP